jgi:hypothetical protein
MKLKQVTVTILKMTQRIYSAWDLSLVNNKIKKFYRMLAMEKMLINGFSR